MVEGRAETRRLGIRGSFRERAESRPFFDVILCTFKKMDISEHF